MITWDVGGRDKIRPQSAAALLPGSRRSLSFLINLLIVKLTLIFDIIGLIFVVDSNDRERIGEAAVELEKILQEDELQETKVLILSNKQGIDPSFSS